MITLPSSASPLIDQTCQHLAEYLMEWLNAAYPAQTIVQSVRCYDANVPYDDYPLLKVYRLADVGGISKIKSSSQIAISYCLVLPELESLAPILAWVRGQIVKALAGFRLDHAGCSPQISEGYRADYRTMLNQVTRQVEAFLRVSLEIQEF